MVSPHLFRFIWAIHLNGCFVIPLCDVLNCNLTGSGYRVLLKGSFSAFPPFWADVFCKWFQHFHIKTACSNKDDDKRVLSIPVTFNSEIPVQDCSNCLDLHELLKEHNVLSLHTFVVNFVHIFSSVQVVDPTIATKIAQLQLGIPQSWTNKVTQCVNNSLSPPCVITDRLYAGFLTSKNFTQLLLPEVVNVKAITSWQRDLDCEIEPFLWTAICKKANLLFLPSLRDFHVQFLH